jgi:hypothetical protein
VVTGSPSLALAANETLTIADKSALNIAGFAIANNPAVIGGPTNAGVTEDTNVSTAATSQGKLIASGKLSITDADAGEAAFNTQKIIPATTNQTTLGSLSLASDGAYTYSVANSARAVSRCR